MEQIISEMKQQRVFTRYIFRWFLIFCFFNGYRPAKIATFSQKIPCLLLLVISNLRRKPIYAFERSYIYMVEALCSRSAIVQYRGVASSHKGWTFQKREENFREWLHTVCNMCHKNSTSLTWQKPNNSVHQFPSISPFCFPLIAEHTTNTYLYNLVTNSSCK